MIKKIVQYIIALSCVVAVGQIPITGLPPANLPLTGNEQVPMVQNNNTVQAKVSNIVPPALTTSPFVVQSSTPSLPQSRTLSAGSGISLTDAGPGNALTVVNTNPTPITSYTQITALWTPPCNAANLFLSGNGTCSNPSTPPGGPNNSVQYNNGGVFGGDANFTWTPGGPGAVITTNVANTTPFTIDASSQINTSGTHYAAVIKSGSSAVPGWTNGLLVQAGAQGGDDAFTVSNWLNNVQFFNLIGNGSGILGNSAGTNGTGLIWTTNNNFTFQPGFADSTLKAMGSSGHFGLEVDAASASGNSYGAWIKGGTGPGDPALWVQNQTGGSNLFELFGDNSGYIGKGTSGPGMYFNSVGNFTIADTAGNAELNVHGHANTFGLLVDTSASAGHGAGLLIEMGSTAGDQPIVIQTVGAGSPQEFLIFGDSHGYLGPNSNPGNGGFNWDTQGHFTWGAPTAAGATAEFDGIAGSATLFVKSASGAGANSNGLFVLGQGTAANDQYVVVNKFSDSTTQFSIFGDGSGYLGRNGPANALSWNSNNNFIFGPPISGTGNTVQSSSIAGGTALNLIQTGASGNILTLNQTGAGQNGNILEFFDNSGNFEMENFSGGSSFFIGNQSNTGTVCLLTNTVCKLTVAADGGILLANGSSVNGGSQGAGTVNATGGYYVNGIPTLTAITANSASISTVETYIPTALTIPAGSLTVGEVFLITGVGTLTSSVSNLLNFNIRLGANGTTADTLLNGSLPIGAGAVNNVVFFNVYVTVRSIGVSGSVFVNFWFGGANAAGYNAINSGTTTINTTGALKLGFSFVSAAGTSSVVFNQAMIQRLN